MVQVKERGGGGEKWKELSLQTNPGILKTTLLAGCYASSSRTDI